jgi:hypothetical protein
MLRKPLVEDSTLLLRQREVCGWLQRVPNVLNEATRS